MAAFRRVLGIVFIVVGGVLLFDAIRQVINGAPIFVNDGFDGPYIVRLFGPGVVALIGGLWLSMRKPSRAHEGVERDTRTVLVHADTGTPGAAAHAPVAVPVVPGVSEVWEPCSRCGSVDVSNVESVSMCSCGNRETAPGTVDAWPACPSCAQPRVTRSRSGRCASCGAIRRTSMQP